MSPKPRRKPPMLYSTKQALEFMGISIHTLKRYRELLGIRPRKMYGVRGRYYFFHELVEIMNLRAPEDRLYKPRVLDRYLAIKADREKEKGAEAESDNPPAAPGNTR